MRTQVYTPDFGWMPSVDEGGEPYYKVSKGETIRVQFTFENNGSSWQSRVVKYYISTNSTITTSDALLGSTNMGLNPDVPLTTTQKLTLPATLTSGQKYWIGVIVDADNALTEFNEANNAAYMGIKIN